MLGGKLGREGDGDEYLVLVLYGLWVEVVMGVLGEVQLLFCGVWNY